VLVFDLRLVSLEAAPRLTIGEIDYWIARAAKRAAKG
jgi:hypothetical protein